MKAAEMIAAQLAHAIMASSRRALQYRIATPGYFSARRSIAA
jgi:hypothetical protein